MKVFLEILVALATGMLVTGGAVAVAVLLVLCILAGAGYGVWRLLHRNNR